MAVAHTERPRSERKPRRRHRRLGYLFAAFVNLVMLVVVHLYPLWIPWTGGVVTGDFAHVLWALDLSLATQVVGNLALAVAHPRLARRLAQLLFTIVGLIGLVVFQQVYPLHVEALVPIAGIDVVVHLGLAVAIVVVAIATVVHAGRVVFWWWGS